MVDKKTDMTTPFPAMDTIVKMIIVNPRRECQSGFMGGNWYQWGSMRWSISIGTLSTTVRFPNLEGPGTMEAAKAVCMGLGGPQPCIGGIPPGLPYP